MDKYDFIRGKLTWCFETRREFGRKRRIMLIQKGHYLVGHLAWHPGAKQIVFEGKCNSTKDLIDYIRPLMNTNTFYRLSRLDRKKRKQKNS